MRATQSTVLNECGFALEPTLSCMSIVTRDLYWEFLNFRLTKKEKKKKSTFNDAGRSYKFSNLAIENQTDQQQKTVTNTKITILQSIKH